MFEGLHPLFQTIIEKSNQLRRLISCYKTAEGRVINLEVHPTENPFVSAHVSRSLEGSGGVSETYQLFVDGRCTEVVDAYIRSITGLVVHMLSRHSRYTPEEIQSYDWLREQLNTIAVWLSDASTVRVNPYDQEEVLRSEEEDVDRNFSVQTNLLQDFRASFRRGREGPEQH